MKKHLEGVGLLSEGAAKKLGWDANAAFFGGLTHDIAKLLLPYHLFDGHNITAEEYAEVKKHSMQGFTALRPFHEFVALCAGLHHALSERGYGITIEDFPKDWSLATIKKVLEISALISICDFIDAFTHRETEIKDGSNKKSSNLEDMLKEKYPNDHRIIEAALQVQKELNL